MHRGSSLIPNCWLRIMLGDMKFNCVNYGMADSTCQGRVNGVNGEIGSFRAPAEDFLLQLFLFCLFFVLRITAETRRALRQLKTLRPLRLSGEIIIRRGAKPGM